MKAIYHSPLVVLLFLLFQALPVAAQTEKSRGISTERIANYENYIKREIEQGKIPGAATQIMLNGQVVYQAAIGSSSLASKRSMKLDDIFFIQSMTKPVITVALMMLYEEGKFQLTDPV